jgi:hypothetical protein
MMKPIPNPTSLRSLTAGCLTPEDRAAVTELARVEALEGALNELVSNCPACGGEGRIIHNSADDALCRDEECAACLAARRLLEER